MSVFWSYANFNLSGGLSYAGLYGMIQTKYKLRKKQNN